MKQRSMLQTAPATVRGRKPPPTIKVGGVGAKATASTKLAKGDPERREALAALRAEKEKATLAKGRKAFLTDAVEKLGGEALAAEKLGVTRAAIWQWTNMSLSVEGAVALAEALKIEYPVALSWATRRLNAPPSARRRGGARQVGNA